MIIDSQTFQETPNLDRFISNPRIPACLKRMLVLTCGFLRTPILWMTALRTCDYGYFTRKVWDIMCLEMGCRRPGLLVHADEASHAIDDVLVKGSAPSVTIHGYARTIQIPGRQQLVKRV